MDHTPLALKEKSRDEKLQWCKDRAIEYVDRGDLSQAVSSMGSDLQKFDELAAASQTFKKLFPLALLNMQNNDASGIRRFINGFN